MVKIFGAILIVLGLVGILWGGFGFTAEKKVLDLGPIQASHEKHHEIPVPPIAGAVSMIAGIALIATDKHS
jgi:xanthosine utilization system XapX-like protein